MKLIWVEIIYKYKMHPKTFRELAGKNKNVKYSLITF